MLVGGTLITRRVRSGGDYGSQIPAFRFPISITSVQALVVEKVPKMIWCLVESLVSVVKPTPVMRGQRRSSNGAGSSVTRRSPGSSMLGTCRQNKEAKAKVEADVER